MVSVLPLSAAPSRNDANELPPALASVVAPGMPVSRKLKPALPPISCWPKPFACWRSKVKPAFHVCGPRTNVTSSFTEILGCSVPLSAAPPHGENSVKVRLPMFTLQSTALGMQILSFQFPPTFGENASLLNVLTPNVKWLTIRDPIQSQVAL